MSGHAEERRVRRCWCCCWCSCWCWWSGGRPTCRTSRFPPDVPLFFHGGDHLSSSNTYAGSAWANDLLIAAR